MTTEPCLYAVRADALVAPHVDGITSEKILQISPATKSLSTTLISEYVSWMLRRTPLDASSASYRSAQCESHRLNASAFHTRNE